MTGDQSDMLARIKAVLPARWFGDSSPVLDAILTGLASAWAAIYAQLTYTKLQTRIATATDDWLDVAANDFFGGSLRRRLNESDADFRTRIEREMVRKRGTRSSVMSSLTDLTGRAPRVIEPWRPGDTGAWGRGHSWYRLAYGSAGCWGSSSLPHQFFVHAYRPVETGVPYVAGWGTVPGGFGAGTLAWMSGESLGNQVTDAEIYQRVAEVLPECATAWVNISS